MCPSTFRSLASIPACIFFWGTYVVRFGAKRKHPFHFASGQVKVEGYEEKAVPVRLLLPHEILHCLVHAPASQVFDSVMLGNLSENARVSFWAHVKTLRPWSDHPALASCDHKRLVGFTFHADGAQMFREDEFMVFSFNSVFSESGMMRDVLAFQFPFCIIPEKHMKTHNAP